MRTDTVPAPPLNDPAQHFPHLDDAHEEDKWEDDHHETVAFNRICQPAVGQIDKGSCHPAAQTGVSGQRPIGTDWWGVFKPLRMNQ